MVGKLGLIAFTLAFMIGCSQGLTGSTNGPIKPPHLGAGHPPGFTPPTANPKGP